MLTSLPLELSQRPTSNQGQAATNTAEGFHAGFHLELGNEVETLALPVDAIPTVEVEEGAFQKTEAPSEVIDEPELEVPALSVAREKASDTALEKGLSRAVSVLENLQTNNATVDLPRKVPDQALRVLPDAPQLAINVPSGRPAAPEGGTEITQGSQRAAPESPGHSKEMGNAARGPFPLDEDGIAHSRANETAIARTADRAQRDAPPLAWSRVDEKTIPARDALHREGLPHEDTRGRHPSPEPLTRERPTFEKPQPQMQPSVNVLQGGPPAFLQDLKDTKEMASRTPEGVAIGTTPESQRVSVNGASTGALLHGAANQAEGARLVAGQVATSIIQAPGGATEIALNPEELGRVKLSLTATEGAVTLSLLAERPETADLLRRHIDVLSQEFRALGYADITFSFGENGTASEQPGDNGGRAADEPHASEEIIRHTQMRHSNGSIDVRL
ncbi:flagellar hook-length control protein FliK [Yoonia litorea]|uniref:Hook-length control protein FliK n=1 Tax=Yoonia litorea TaxID=1123755 RepID=A0A1I6MTX5_9RHOB|nr:flagellar hook-length control protein FliK [Yoonia litorea]SFS19170.1 hook-length control protein FliK [Yoonia litorea]